MRSQVLDRGPELSGITQMGTSSNAVALWTPGVSRDYKRIEVAPLESCVSRDALENNLPVSKPKPYCRLPIQALHASHSISIASNII